MIIQKVTCLQILIYLWEQIDKQRYWELYLHAKWWNTDAKLAQSFSKVKICTFVIFVEVLLVDINLQ